LEIASYRNVGKCYVHMIQSGQILLQTMHK
jgi:hypothetical protein